MLIRLGYACISETLSNISSSHTYTYTNYTKENNLQKLDSIIQTNLLELEKILIYNVRNNIHFYRLSSGIIPLATKKDVDFDYLSSYMQYYNRIADVILKSRMRVDFHPSEFCVLNSTRKEVVENSIEILKYHYQLLKLFHVEEKILILHVGSGAGGKKRAISRFIHTFFLLPKYLQDIIVIENDDKVFTVEDCLVISRRTGIPICMDYHHTLCNPSKIDYIEIFNTWREKNIRPKMHFSSPKSKIKKDFRSHHDYIDSTSFIQFIEEIKKYSFDLDIMIEAKRKDEAMFRLIRELKYKTNYCFLDETTFKV